MEKTAAPVPKMTVWYLLPKLGLGGAERHVISLADGLRERGVNAGIACVFEEGILAEEARKRRIPFVCLNVSGGTWGLKTLVRIFRWLRSTPTDIFHTYLFGFDFFGTFPARLLKIPGIVSSRREIAVWQKWKHLLLGKLGNLFVDRIVCCSHAVEEWTLKKENSDRKKICTIYNGLKLGIFSLSAISDSLENEAVRAEFGIPAGKILIGTVANFSEIKGYGYLIEAAAKILREMPSAWFLFVGGGPLLDEMKKKAAALPGFRQIIFTGFRLDVPRLVGAMDYFVFASLAEGFPNVLLEAMAMGKPVIATKAGGIPELIEDGKDGRLVEPANAADLAEGVLSLMNDPAAAERLGETACRKMERNFSIERMLDEYERFYFSLLQEKRRV